MKLLKSEQNYINSRIRAVFLPNNIWTLTKPNCFTLTIFVRIKTKIHSSWNFDSRTDDIAIFSGSIVEACKMLNNPLMIKEVNNVLHKKRKELRRKKD